MEIREIELPLSAEAVSKETSDGQSDGSGKAYRNFLISPIEVTVAARKNYRCYGKNISWPSGDLMRR